MWVIQLEVIASAKKQEKEINGTQVVKEPVKPTYLQMKWLISVINTVKLNVFRKVTGCQISVYKNQLCVCIPTK